jgi:hypothetical protein
MNDDLHTCRQRALECARQALYAKERRERKALTAAAKTWLDIAMELEARQMSGDKLRREAALQRMSAAGTPRT